MLKKMVLLLFLLLAFLPAAVYADDIILQVTPSSNYEIKGYSSTIVTTPGTTITGDLTFVSKQSFSLNLFVEASCSNAGDVDKSCEWMSFDGKNIVLPEFGTATLPYKVTVPSDAKSNSYIFYLTVRDGSNIKILPVELRMGGTQTEWTSGLSFLSWGIELPKPCMKFADVTANASANATGEPACEKLLSIPVWFILVIVAIVVVALWRLR